MANIQFKDKHSIIDQYDGIPDAVQKKINEIEHSMYDRLSTQKIKKTVARLINKFHKGDYNELDVHALHVFMQSYIKTRVNPPVITDHTLGKDQCQLARLISVHQDHGYRKGQPVDTERMRSYLDENYMYQDGEVTSLAKKYGRLVHADDDMASYVKNDDMTVTFRGSRTNMFDPNFASDWEYNWKTTMSDSASAKHLETSRRAVASVRKVLSENPGVKRLLVSGFSKGGGLAHFVAEELAEDFPDVKISAETFNAHINMLHNFKDPKVEHRVNRTDEDPAGTAIGFKEIDPSKVHVHSYSSQKGCNNSADSHDLKKNFCDWNVPRAHYNLAQEALDRNSTLEALIREQKIAGISATGLQLSPEQMDQVVDHITSADLEGPETDLQTKVTRMIDPQTSQINTVGTDAIPIPEPSMASSVGVPTNRQMPAGPSPDIPPPATHFEMDT
jgi:hypothetical protein